MTFSSRNQSEKAQSSKKPQIAIDFYYLSCYNLVDMHINYFSIKQMRKDKCKLSAEKDCQINEKKINKTHYYIFLHIVLVLSSLGGIASKLAGRQPFLSPMFFLYYGLVLLCLAVYAVLWQQVLKHVPLMTAFCNKAVTIIWGLIWGALFFKETITVYNIIGSLIVFIGIILVVTDKK